MKEFLYADVYPSSLRLPLTRFSLRETTTLSRRCPLIITRFQPQNDKLLLSYASTPRRNRGDVVLYNYFMSVWARPSMGMYVSQNLYLTFMLVNTACRLTVDYLPVLATTLSPVTQCFTEHARRTAERRNQLRSPHSLHPWAAA